MLKWLISYIFAFIAGGHVGHISVYTMLHTLTYVVVCTLELTADLMKSFRDNFGLNLWLPSTGTLRERLTTLRDPHLVLFTNNKIVTWSPVYEETTV